MKKKILILLGNENTEQGALSETALIRSNLAIEKAKNDEQYMILPTGSFGDHFNVSSTPHGELLTNYLIKNGIDSSRILPFTQTSNTVEDSYGVLQYLNKHNIYDEIHIITSEFHMERVKYIFGRVLQNYKIKYFEANNPNDNNLISKRKRHEVKALKKLKEEWVDISNFDLNKFPSQSYENLGNELRHYDTLSYYALIAVFLCFTYILHNINDFKQPYGPAGYFLGIIIICLIYYLYSRLASTAASARRIMITIEKLYKIPGISSTKNKSLIFKKSLSIKNAVKIILSLLIIYLLAKPLL